MKRTHILSLVILLLLSMTGCSGKTKSIDIDDISVNTMLVRANGEIQVASVENFDKEYYNLSDLQNFVDQEVSTYSKEAGADKVTVNAVELKDNKAYLLLTYSGMDQYCAFNKANAAYFTGGVGDVSLTLPNTLITVGNEALASTQDIIKDSKYKILVVNEPYNIVVEGKVAYYSDQAKLIDKNEVQGAPEGMTIVVFK